MQNIISRLNSNHVFNRNFCIHYVISTTETNITNILLTKKYSNLIICERKISKFHGKTLPILTYKYKPTSIVPSQTDGGYVNKLPSTSPPDDGSLQSTFADQEEQLLTADLTSQNQSASCRQRMLASPHQSVQTSCLRRQQTQNLKRLTMSGSSGTVVALQTETSYEDCLQQCLHQSTNMCLL